MCDDTTKDKDNEQTQDTSNQEEAAAVQQPAETQQAQQPPQPQQGAEENDAGQAAEEATEAAPTVEELQAEIARLQELYEQEHDKHLRAQAELRNFRRRAMEERAQLLQYAVQELITALLPVIDHLELALEHHQQGQDPATCMDGVRMTYQQLMNILAQFGLQPIEAEGSFDPELHEAVERQPTSEVSEGTILAQVRKGYKLHDRVARPAQVKVAVAPSDTPDS